jgi:hypothetical protein
MSVGEPGHELTATPRDQDGATICECGWVSKPGVDAQPFLEAREHILSVRAGEASAWSGMTRPGLGHTEGTATETAWIGCYASHVLAGSLVCR